jgi:hypothetical protein
MSRPSPRPARYRRSADAVARFEHEHAQSRSRQVMRRRKPCRARADDYHLRFISRQRLGHHVTRQD